MYEFMGSVIKEEKVEFNEDVLRMLGLEPFVEKKYHQAPEVPAPPPPASVDTVQGSEWFRDDVVPWSSNGRALEDWDNVQILLEKTSPELANEITICNPASFLAGSIYCTLDDVD
jgi:hypothetical protein